MPVETRYFKNASVTINGLTCKSLALDQSGTEFVSSKTVNVAAFGGYMGIRVWKRSEAGVETEITEGVPVAQIETVDGDYRLTKSNTWNCPETSLADTDSIVVRVYVYINAWYLLTTSVFSTEQLGDSQLDSAEWTVYYVESHSFQMVGYTPKTTITFYFDGVNEGIDSRIENFTWTSIAPPPPEKVSHGDGLTFWD